MPEILHLWEDDYLMIELLPFENLEFIKSETQRISHFGKEHFDGLGFTEITPVGKKPVKTIDKLIDIFEVEKLIIKSGLNKIDKFHVQFEGIVEGIKAPFGFGTNEFAIICDRKESLLEHIWLTGHTKAHDDKQKLIEALLKFGNDYNFVGVNWYKCSYYNLIEKISVEEFVITSC